MRTFDLFEMLCSICQLLPQHIGINFLLNIVGNLIATSLHLLQFPLQLVLLLTELLHPLFLFVHGLFQIL